MNLRNLVSAALLAAAVFAGPAAQADTVRRTIPIVLQADGAGGYHALFGNTFTRSDASSYIFYDTYVFTVENMAGFIPYGALTSLYTQMSPGVSQSGPLIKDLYFYGFGLYSYANGQVGDAYSTLHTEYVYDPTYSHSLERWTFDSGRNLSPGTWAVQVSGFVEGNAGGSYSANIALMPIPEPQAGGMLLAGLGLIGALGLRRKARRLDAEGPETR